MAKEKVKVRRSSADKAVNVLIAIVLVVVLVLAAYALYDEFRPKDRLKDIANERGMTVEDFMSEFGIENASPNAKFNDIYNDLTIENAVKLDGMSFEDFMATAQLPETVTPDMKVSEVQKIFEEMAAAEAEGEEAPAEGEEAPAE